MDRPLTEREGPVQENTLAMKKQHRIVFAVDGSRTSEAALATALQFPWPASTRASAVVARFSSWLPAISEQARAAFEISFQAAAAVARRALSGRWPESKVVLVDAPPVDAILAEAVRFEASLIVLGWRGHGVFRRLLAGSVSRSVAERAQCPVLVVRTPARRIHRFVVGFDGCPNAERALDLLSSLEPGRSSRVVLVNVVEPLSVPASARHLPSSARAQLRYEVAAINEQRHQQGLATAAAGVARLEGAGWKAKAEVRVGAPLASLLQAVADHRGDVLVVGARATSGVQRALLGSVASGALNAAPVVLLVR